MFDNVSDISHSTRYGSTSAENDTTFDSDSFSLNHELGLYLPCQHQTEIIKAQATQDIKHHFPEPQKERKAIIEDADPDIIISTETWLDSTIGSADPAEAGYFSLVTSYWLLIHLLFTDSVYWLLIRLLVTDSIYWLLIRFNGY